MMTKRTLDTWGGLGSIAAGVGCIWFAGQHSFHESIWKVWVAFSLLLVGNGILMIVHARRKGGLPAIAQQLLQTNASEEHKAHV